MAGMRAVHKKTGTTFKFTGDIKECIERVEKELKEKQESQERVFLKWQRDKAVKAWESYEKRISDLKDFIPLAKNELRKREEGQQDGKSENI